MKNLKKRKEGEVVSKKYLVEDITDCKDKCDPSSFTVLSDQEIFGYIDTARQDKLQIAIYEVGELLIDWTNKWT